MGRLADGAVQLVGRAHGSGGWPETAGGGEYGDFPGRHDADL